LKQTVKALLEYATIATPTTGSSNAAISVAITAGMVGVGSPARISPTTRR
jgi:hypothetical protein